MRCSEINAQIVALRPRATVNLAYLETVAADDLIERYEHLSKQMRKMFQSRILDQVRLTGDPPKPVSRAFLSSHLSAHHARVGRDWASPSRPHAARKKHFNPRARVGRDGACLHGLNYSGRAIFFANLIFVRAVTGIFRRKVLCVIRVRTEILRPFLRRRCLLQHQSSFSFITWFCTDVLRFSCVFIS